MQNTHFVLTRNVNIDTEMDNEPVRRAISRFYRDLAMTLKPSDEPAKEGGPGIIHLIKGDLPAEEFYIRTEDSGTMEIAASEELGFIYAFFYISEHCLGILPFWFWNDQKFVKRSRIEVPFTEYHSKRKPVAYRGWFINDEVLISRWSAEQSTEYPWEMAFEALLRCGGNTVIPGTDSNSKKYADLAGSMGLWMTQHHAEPLGAEMFLRAYPDKIPSFKEYPDLFRGLWEEGIKRQMKHKIIWNLGFRGQGDTPFWENDPQYDTPKKRGQLISSIMKEQYDLVKKYVDNPVFGTNLYGETMELYRQGYLQLPENVIMIWADNGYGKMVSRRQGNHNPRVPALPEKELRNRSHGVYYHVSFYDLQAANVLTMLPNSMEFVKKELGNAYDHGIRTLWLVNCSNIKPHIYPLDFTAALWNCLETEPEEHLETYLRQYYGSKSSAEMKACFEDYFRAALPYGDREDEHAGEQFYNYVTRVLIHQWMKDGGKAASEELRWCGAAQDFAGQVSWFVSKCENAYPGFARLLHRCRVVASELGDSSGRLWKDSLQLQANIHACCLEGVICFGKGYAAYAAGDYLKAFYETGRASDCFDRAEKAMKECCHDKWKGFYDNDCQTDIKETAYLLKLLMGYIRNLGDGPYFYQWQRQVIYPEKDRKIMLLLNYENHLTDEELYRAMKEKDWGGF
ncbi:glycosyl hydrolase 115 family protein [Clostridium sp. MCC353]|uniref:glycosyl hydrolase 115 family protein n=1 Tax=Clostridium sp. MCC353 TaxID=2592646 RepID=UPI001C017A70|nr:glycosyl hydrolase 115 family protein [Clostridium sp. MCC353]